jgi:hypothetical protein
MDLLSLVVDLLEELHVFSHDLGVLLLVDVLVFLKHGSEVVDVVLKILSLLRVLLVQVSVSSLLLHLFLDILLVQTNDSCLQLLKVGDVVENLKHIILEGFFVTLLLVKVLTKLLHLISKTFLTHSQIVNNQSQVLVDSVEELEFLAHFVGLLVELLDLKLSWPNVSLQLLNLVVEHELELFKLLGLLSQIINSLVLVFDGSGSLLQLTLLRLNGLLQVVCLPVKI